MPIKKGYRESSRDLMRKFYEKNNYPTLEERRLIAEQSGLNIGIDLDHFHFRWL